MKKFLKTSIFLLLAIVAVISYSCKKNDPSTSGDYDDTSGSGNNSSTGSYISYNTADGYYYGDALNLGTALFSVDMYNATDDQIGIFITGFTKLPSSAANFDISGPYNLASTGGTLTFLPGSIVNNQLSGSYIYNYNTQKFILITGGNFAVLFTGGKYVIATDFTGKDYSTGATVDSLRYGYTGAIAFADNSGGGSGGSSSMSFSDIVKSNYTAKGTPGFLATPGPATWTGQVTPSSGQDQFYDISGWGGQSIDVYCDFKDGNIVLDNYTIVAVDNTSGYNGYFQAIALDTGAMKYYILDNDYIVKYDKTNKVLDFSGTYNGLPVYVGVIAKSKTTGEIGGAFTELYANAKLTLTSTSKSSGNPNLISEKFSSSASVSPEELKGYTIIKESNIKKTTGISFTNKIIKE